MRPAFIFEEVTGVKGIAGHYHYPNVMVDGRMMRLTPFKLFVLCGYIHYRVMAEYHNVPELKISQKDAHELIKPLYEAMMKANPEMSDLVHHDYKQKHHILSGMASGFNKDDIHSFLMGQYFYVVTKNPQYMGTMQEVVALSGIEHLNWVPAHKTLKKMAEGLCAKATLKARKTPFKKD